MEVIGTPRIAANWSDAVTWGYLNLQLASEVRVTFFSPLSSSSLSLFLIPEVFIGLLPHKGCLTFAT